MKSKSLLILLLALPFVMSCGDSGATTINQGFTWTAPGDDGNLGTAALYDLRCSLDEGIDWDSWLELDGEPLPGPAGTAETCFVSLDVIEGTTYYFAIKTADEASNWSELSNIVKITFADAIAPAPIIDLDRLDQE